MTRESVAKNMTLSQVIRWPFLIYEIFVGIRYISLVYFVLWHIKRNGLFNAHNFGGISSYE